MQVRFPLFFKGSSQRTCAHPHRTWRRYGKRTTTQQLPAQGHQSANRQANNVHPATKQLDGQMQPTSQPSSLTGTPNVLSPYATKQLDDTVITSHTAAQPTAETPPPSSLTVRGSRPAPAKQLDRNANVLSTPPYATKQLDDTVITSYTAAQPTAETPPPSSLTVRGSSPAPAKQLDRNAKCPLDTALCHQAA